MDSANLTVGLAFIAGLASFLSPCVFSLVPAYIGYLSGRSGTSENGQPNRLGTLSHGLAFVLGFSLVFVVMGVFASALGGLLYDLRILLAKVGGVVIILFGLYMTGILRKAVSWMGSRFTTGTPGKVAGFITNATSYLDYDTRVQADTSRKNGYLSSVLMGVFFSAGWSPCVGPILGTILTLALSGGSISWGLVMLTAYSAGLAIPFLFAATQIGLVTTIIRRYSKVSHYVEIVMGVVMIIIGIMLLQGTFQRLSGLGINLLVENEVTMGKYLLFGLAALALLGLIPAFIARSKGRNFFDWWFFGASLFVIALPWSLLMKPSEKAEEADSQPSPVGTGR